LKEEPEDLRKPLSTRKRGDANIVDTGGKKKKKITFEGGRKSPF